MVLETIALLRQILHAQGDRPVYVVTEVGPEEFADEKAVSKVIVNDEDAEICLHSDVSSEREPLTISKLISALSRIETARQRYSVIARCPIDKVIGGVRYTKLDQPIKRVRVGESRMHLVLESY